MIVFADAPRRSALNFWEDRLDDIGIPYEVRSNCTHCAATGRPFPKGQASGYKLDNIKRIFFIVINGNDWEKHQTVINQKLPEAMAQWKGWGPEVFQQLITRGDTRYLKNVVYKD